MREVPTDQVCAPSAEGLCYTEEEASEAMDRMLAADEDGGAWLFDLSPLGAGYVIVRDLPFTAEDEEDFRRRTADLLSVGPDRFTVRRVKQNHAMRWRFGPPLGRAEHRRIYKWLGEERDRVEFEASYPLG